MNNYQVPLFFPLPFRHSHDVTRALVTTTLSHRALNPVCSPGQDRVWCHIRCMEPGEKLRMWHLLDCTGFSVVAPSLYWDHWSSSAGRDFADLGIGDRVARHIGLTSHTGHGLWWPCCCSCLSANLSLSLKLLLIFPNEVNSRDFPVTYFMWAVWGRTEGDQIRFSCSLL